MKKPRASLRKQSRFASGKPNESKKNFGRERVATAKPAIKHSKIGDGLNKSFSFPIVAIGASAGGLEAVTSLLQFLPSDTGVAFVLLQHLDPGHSSALSKILDH